MTEHPCYLSLTWQDDEAFVNASRPSGTLLKVALTEAQVIRMIREATVALERFAKRREA